MSPYPHAPGDPPPMTDADRDTMRREDHGLLSGLVAMMRQFMIGVAADREAAAKDRHDTAARFLAIEGRIHREQMRGEMRDKELLKVASDIATVREATDRIEMHTSIIVEQFRQADRAQAADIEAVAKRPRHWLAVSLDGGAVKAAAYGLGWALMGAGALYFSRYGTPEWMAPWLLHIWPTP